MTTKLVGVGVAVLGIALAVVSALANQLDIGRHGFGWKQIVGIVVGVGVALVGAGVVARNSRSAGI